MSATSTTKLNPPPTHREEGRVRLCGGCGAYLRSFTNQDRCDPCRKGAVDPLDMNDVLDRINSLPFGQREAAFAALSQLHEAQIEP